MRVVVGLGNPGEAYARSRHNVGFAVVTELARRWALSLHATSSALHVAESDRSGAPTLLALPQMYMNRSGEALTRLQPPVTAAQLIVVHDDLDLDLGMLRVKRGGGTAGHHGLDSIVEHYGHNFTRVRVGVNRPPHGEDVATYVLAQFDTHEKESAGAAIQRAADAVECVLRDGEEAAMNRFNARTSSRQQPQQPT